MLSLKNITFKYPDNSSNYLFHDFNLEIINNELVTILGPSGCGKSTLASLIAGYFQVESGEILFNNSKVVGPNKNRVIINQENDLFEWMNVYENMRLVTKDTNNINQLLELTQLIKYKDYYPIELSGGMKKRLSLARALAVKTNFIIMDEPFSSQDIDIKNKMQKELLNIAKKQNKTILLITHDIEEAIFLSDRIIVLREKPVRVIGEYKKPFVGFQNNYMDIDGKFSFKDQLIS